LSGNSYVPKRFGLDIAYDGRKALMLAQEMKGRSPAFFRPWPILRKKPAMIVRSGFGMAAAQPVAAFCFR
jgi:hypothetical protein